MSTMLRSSHPAPSQTGRITAGDWAAVVIFGALFVVAIALGGGGVRYALANLVVQLTALAVLAIRREAAVEFWRSAPLTIRALVVLTMVLPVLHLIPLPQGMWSTLPGRDLVVQSFELTGRSGWAPASVDPVRTLVALTGLIAPVAVITAGWSAKRSQLLLLGWLVVALGLVNVLVGIPQVLSGGTTAMIYGDARNLGVLYGTFANRNSTGLFLVAAMTLAALLPPPRAHPAVLPARLAACLLLIVAVVLTRSRTALVLSAIPVMLAAVHAYGSVRSARSGLGAKQARFGWAAATALALTIGAISAAVTIAPGRIGETIERFEASEDARQYIWEDAAYSASRYWPAGAGMGTFDEVFQLDESLEHATLRRAGRAHNDYLEVAIEAGLPGLALIGAWLALVGWLAWRARHASSRWIAWSGAAVLLAVALQSITDYPLRNQAMLAIAAFAFVLLARFGNGRAENGR